MGKGPLFLNTPITSLGNDVVGIETHVEKLDMAIDAGATMIAITSPFGAGKSSVIELLEKKRGEKQKDRKYRRAHGRERFIETSMWSHLGEAREESCSDLHRTFVYQLANQIAPQKGTYVNRRLSRNYGLLRLYANSRIHWILTMAAILMSALWWTIHAFDEKLRELIPWLEGKTDILSAVLLFGAIFFAIVVLIRADIIFSSNKSEGERTVEGDEIIDIYRTELLKPRYLRWKLWMKWRKGTHYIVVIEDLDRTDKPEVILQFLKELRKYYIPERTAISYLNRVTFLVNIKPESELATSETSEKSEKESLYAKIFDYVLPLRTINIDNYDAVLDGLLAEHKDELQALEFSISQGMPLSRLPGMQWIIRERRLGIREIKERLNIAFSLFESLRQKFPAGGIVFEKCAAVAYLVTAFEADFCKTSDRAYQELLDLYLKEEPETSFQYVADACREFLPDTGEEYQKAVWELIHAKLIDTSYRTYFYNYPKESYFYTPNESAVMNAILYGETFPGLERAAAELSGTHSPVMEAAYQKLGQLGVPLPGFVLEVEPLYIKAVQVCFEDVLKRLALLDYSQESVQKNIQLFRNMLAFDAKREVIGKRHMEAICSLWEREMSEPALLQLRRMLCERFPEEIIWYRALFFGVHNMATTDEMDQLSFLDILELLNREQLSAKEAAYIVQRFSALEDQTRGDVVGRAEEFLRDALAVLGIEETAKFLLQFMRTMDKLTLDFESAVGAYICEMDSGKEKELLITDYQALINQVAPQGIEKETARRISKIDRYTGYTPETARCLLENGFLLDYVLLTLVQGGEISYEKEDTVHTIEKNETWLFRNHPELFGQLRFHVASTRPQAIERYRFLFGESRPLMNELEIHALENQKGDVEALVIGLIPAARVTQEELGYLKAFFCRRKQTTASVMNILKFVSQMEPEIAREFFFQLDFSKIGYRNLSETRKTEVKNILGEVLELELAESKLKFMKATQHLDPVWEEALLPEMRENKELQRPYVDAVNVCEKLSKNTIGVITNLGTTYGTAPHVTEKAFQAKKYFWYATSKILWEGTFVMEEGERGELLWRSYLDIFGKDRDASWNGVKRSMRKNEDFLYKVMETGTYKAFEDESRMELAGILQSSASITEVLERGTQYALNYYLRIKGFQDWDAANTFVELVSKNPTLLASEELYEHTHGRLVNGALKGKYTNRRKKNA